MRRRIILPSVITSKQPSCLTQKKRCSKDNILENTAGFLLRVVVL